MATSGGQDGRAIALNDNGDLAFQLDFSDGTNGVFSVHVPVPEPSTAGLLVLATASLVARRRRSR
jgi:hypothetical protein